jgi:NADH:ubiquinone oxidoreductase subunit E
MILRINSDYLPKQRQPVDLCNGEVLCFLCGTDCILKYYSDELRLQRVKIKSTKS